jgi:hypothetical protein
MQISSHHIGDINDPTDKFIRARLIDSHARFKL